jgi:hypothetical protein
MGLRKRRKIAYGLFLVLSLTFFVSLASAGSVTRSFSAPAVNPGAALQVNLSVDINEGDPLENYSYIQEEVPAGWIITNNGSALEVDGQNITWAYGPDPVDMIISYVVQAPPPPGFGDYYFNGVYAIGNPILHAVLGDNIVSVVSIITCTDADGDGWNSTSGGNCGLAADCNDTNADVHPGAVEDCINQIDDNCDGTCDTLFSTCSDGSIPGDPECNGYQCLDDGDCLDDGIACTYVTCDAGVCNHHENDSVCNDTLWCNGNEICSIANSGCIPAMNTPDCNDSIDCSSDYCDEGNDQCLNILNNSLCGLGEECIPEDPNAGENGCVYTADSICGNEVVEPGEQCDCGINGCIIEELNYENCSSQDYPAGGNLDCYPSSHPALNCTFDYIGCSLLPKYTKFNGTTTNFRNELDIGHVINSLLEINDSGLLNYSGASLNYTRLDLDEYVTIETRKIGVDLSGNRMINLNSTGYLEFYNLSLSNPRLFRNGVLCSEEICNVTNYTYGGKFEATVKGFSIYEVVACGDGECNGDETCASCSDCGPCPPGGDDDSGGGGDDDSGGGGPPGPTKTQCNDKIDNDLDGYVDYPNDPSCDSQVDNNEFPFDRLVSPPSCDEQWVCTEWSLCNEQNIKTRNCNDEHVCGTALLRPQTEEFCETPGPVETGFRLDIIFAVIASVLSAGAAITGLVFWLRHRYGLGGIIKKRNELINAVKESVV